MGTSIKEVDLKNSDELEKVFPVLKQLRPHLTFDDFCEMSPRLSEEGYKLWAYTQNDEVLGLVSTRAYTDWVRGSHLYIDDLVTDNRSRSRGVGAALLNKVEQVAKEQKLPILRLCCVIENEGGMKFYRREGWKERAFSLVKRI